MIKNFVKILELLGDRLEVCVSVFLFYKTIADWPNFCKLQTGSPYFTPQIHIH